MHDSRRRKLVLLIGILLLVAGLVMCIYPYISLPSDLDRESLYTGYGPKINVACNKPNQEILVTMTTDLEGRTDISFCCYPEDAEELKVWIVIDDAYAPFTWNIMEETSLVNMFTVDGKAYASEKNDSVYGAGKYAEFQMNFGKNIARANTIRIETELSDYLVKNREDCWLRLPVVLPWWSEDVHIECGEDKLSLDDPKWIDKTMDGEVLYCPAMRFNAVVDNLAVEHKELVLKSVSPGGRVSGLCVWWRTTFIYAVQIYYMDENWQKKMEILEILAPVFAGMGMSNIFCAIADKKKELEEES